MFARAQKRITVRPFKTSVLKSILSDYNPQYTPDDLLTLYAITGGVAWYVTLLMDDGCYDRRKMLEALTDRNSLFVNEGRNILVEEFGKEYTTYFSILSCIADGMYSRGEIETRLNMDNLGSYLKRLEDDFQLIKRHVPIFETASSKKTRYELNDNFLILWFRFFYKYQALVENDALGQLAVSSRVISTNSLGSASNAISGKNCVRRDATRVSAGSGTEVEKTKSTSWPSTRLTILPTSSK